MTYTMIINKNLGMRPSRRKFSIATLHKEILDQENHLIELGIDYKSVSCSRHPQGLSKHQRDF